MYFKYGFIKSIYGMIFLNMNIMVQEIKFPIWMRLEPRVLRNEKNLNVKDLSTTDLPCMLADFTQVPASPPGFK